MYDAVRDEIHAYWFADLKGDLAYFEERLPFWFRDGKASDAIIIERFGAAHAAAARGELASWAKTPKGAVSQIVLLDQFSRNIHRGQATAFAHDAVALALAKTLIDNGGDTTLHPVERLFAYMPFQHAEDVDDQKRSVELFQLLADDIQSTVEPEVHKHYVGCAGFARGHHDIIERFGRFPHRNDVLGRTCSPEELAYLETAERFGQ